ncbi:MAG: hypothetical protein IPM60_08210 [Rhodospirillales bacterium]|nr:hypothetical protein [Rhodospirillales bacterium]
MSNYFKSHDGYHYPHSAVERFKVCANSNVAHVDVALGDDVVTVTAPSRQFANRKEQFVAAAPGTHLLNVSLDEPPELLKEPVLAWQVRERVYPVVADPDSLSELKDGSGWVVELPGGTVITPSACEIVANSAAEWFETATEIDGDV